MSEIAPIKPVVKPYCFVLMPFGEKTDDSGRPIDFDRVYSEIIQPACNKAGLEAIRADEELVGGIIHKPMFERLMLCDYAIADLTTANPNVFYELGIRHGIRPHSTVLIFGKGMRLPFDVAPLRGLPYELDETGLPSSIQTDCESLAGRLQDCRNPTEDSPLFQLISEWPRPDIARLKTDTFRDLVEYSKEVKGQLKIARRAGTEAILQIERSLNVRDADPAIVIDLFLSYRAVKDWASMIRVVGDMSPILARTVLVQEQLGFALNRAGRAEDAEATLSAIVSNHGPSSETNGILGRVYKDQWESALNAGDEKLAAGFLQKAIETYVQGFETDWRDAYPGINALTLMEVQGNDPRYHALLPVVRYAVTRRIASNMADYWDHATLLEISVLADDEDAANKALPQALISVREKWEPESTARNLNLIRTARASRGSKVEWIEEIVNLLLKRAH
jgi:hypothetical protein